MATRIIQVYQPNEFWEQFRKDGKYQQSQKRSGRTANIKEGDIVFIFITESDVQNGDIRYKCCVTKTNENAKNSEDKYVTLNLRETYSKGTCTYGDLLNNGFIKNSFFHWNIVPELTEFIRGNRKTDETKKKPSKKEALKTTVKKANFKNKDKEKAALKKKDIKKKDEKKKDVKDVKKKDNKKKDVNKKKK